MVLPFDTFSAKSKQALWNTATKVRFFKLFFQNPILPNRKINACLFLLVYIEYLQQFSALFPSKIIRLVYQLTFFFIIELKFSTFV